MLQKSAARGGLGSRRNCEENNGNGKALPAETHHHAPSITQKIE
jgi:hypothetical protein